MEDYVVCADSFGYPPDGLATKGLSLPFGATINQWFLSEASFIERFWLPPALIDSVTSLVLTRIHNNRWKPTRCAQTRDGMIMVH